MFLKFPPRLIRLRDAPCYLGMDRNKFNREVRPLLVEIPLGIQSIAFDRLDLDAWVDDYKSRNGRPGQLEGDQLWDKKERRDCTKGTISGTSTKSSMGGGFEKAAKQALLSKPML